MRDIIKAIIGEDHFFKCQTYSIARNGEGLTPCFEIDIPDGLRRFWAYIDFKKPNGEKFKTPKIETDEGKLVYNMPCGVLDVEGTLEVQVIFQNADGEIWKTYVKEFAVRYSINAVDDIPNKEDFITDAQRILDEATSVLDQVNGEVGEIQTELDNKVNQDLFNGVVLNLSDEIDKKADVSSLDSKANLIDLQSKMDKVMGTDIQYAGFDGIAPQVRAITPDTKPTENSTKLITSGGVYVAIGDIETALDSIIAIQNNLIGGGN